MPPRKKKKSRQNEYQDALNEVEDLRADEMRNLANMKFRTKIKCKNVKQKKLIKTIKENKITFVTGSPGTGKTIIALKAALDIIKSDRYPIENLLLTTPIIEISPKSIGALPGDLDMKIMHYFEHFFDNLEKIVDKKVIKFLREAGIIEEKIINFMRGKTFGKHDEDGNPIGTIAILDEAQNLSYMEMKSYVSRLGENSKMIIIGDPDQCDLKLKSGEKNGLVDAINRFQGMNEVGFIEFDEDDIVRDPFLIEIMKRYKD